MKHSELVKSKRYKVCEMLVEHGADVNFKVQYVNMTPLHWAAYNADSKVT